MYLRKNNTKFIFPSFPTVRYGLGALKNCFRDLTDTKTYEVLTLQSCFLYIEIVAIVCSLSSNVRFYSTSNSYVDNTALGILNVSSEIRHLRSFPV